jgi:long-chain acyl-CoA synthetase
MSAPETIAGRLLALCRASEDAPAVLSKRYGRWIQRSRSEVLRGAATIAVGLRDHGVTPGDVGVLLLNPHTAWITHDLGLQLAGLRSLALPPAMDSVTAADLIETSGATLIVVQNQDVADMVLALGLEGRIPAVTTIVYVDPAGVAEYDDSRLVASDVIQNAGADSLGEGWDRIAELVASIDPASPAVVVATPGVSREPRLSQLSHAAVLHGAAATVEAFKLTEADRVLALRPMGDPIERGATIYPALLSGALLALPETVATATQALNEIAPTYVHATPRWLKDVAGAIRIRMQAAGGIKRVVNRWWSRKVRSAATSDQPMSTSVVSRSLVAYPVTQQLGVDRIRHLVVSGAAIPREALLFFEALDVRVSPAYSLAEAAGFVSGWFTDGRPDVTCGPPLPGYELRLADDGEVLVRGPGLATGYLTTEGLDTEAFSDEGWLHTQDLGTQRDDQIEIADRPEGDATAAPDYRLWPGRLERALRASPYIREAVVGTEGDRVIAVVEIFDRTVGRWATREELVYTTFRSLSQLPEVHALIERAAATAVEKVDGARLDEVRVLDAPLEQLAGTLTPTGKVRRSAVWQEATRAPLQSDVPIRDGGLPPSGARVG